MASRQTLWYTRRAGVVQGPFPRGLITRYVILGRIVPGDELSQDLVTWTPLEELADLIPEVMQEDDPGGRRLLAARRWENERERQDRRRELNAIEDDQRDASERRAEAGAGRGPALRHEDLAEHRMRRGRLRRHAGIVALGIIAALAAVLILYRPPPPPASADCRLAPRPGVNWNNCAMDGRMLARSDLAGAQMNNMSLSGADLSGSRLTGADLSFANLSVANLSGADLMGAQLVGTALRGADLAQAALDGADLSYADLQGAMLRGARLEGVRFDNAVWVDGTLCAAGSVGECLPGTP